MLTAKIQVCFTTNVSPGLGQRFKPVKIPLLFKHPRYLLDDLNYQLTVRNTIWRQYSYFPGRVYPDGNAISI